MQPARQLTTKLHPKQLSADKWGETAPFSAGSKQKQPITEAGRCERRQPGAAGQCLELTSGSQHLQCLYPRWDGDIPQPPRPAQGPIASQITARGVLSPDLCPICRWVPARSHRCLWILTHIGSPPRSAALLGWRQWGTHVDVSLQAQLSPSGSDLQRLVAN